MIWQAPVRRGRGHLSGNQQQTPSQTENNDMPSLNERLRQLEQMQGAEDALLLALAAIEPERLAGTLREGIHALERECAEGRGDGPLRQPHAARAARAPWGTASEALPALRAALADLERDHDVAR